MKLQLGVVMDPIGSINIKKDSTFAMLLAAQARGWPIAYMELADLYVRDGIAYGRMRELSVRRDAKPWYTYGEERVAPLAHLDVVLMRKDPPFNMDYIYATYILELAETQGTLVANKPQALRDANEKFFITRFPQCTTPTLVTRRRSQLQEFLREHGDIIVKPLDGMGGADIFRVRDDDPNKNVIFEIMTERDARLTMAQKFIPQISAGDKRILLVDGEPVPYALARIPALGESRGNLAAGGRGEGRPLTERDRWICAQVAPTLRERGILFAGLDVIGDYLTEINVTSPTCIQELDAQYGLDIGGQFMDALARRRAQHSMRRA